MYSVSPGAIVPVIVPESLPAGESVRDQKPFTLAGAFALFTTTRRSSVSIDASSGRSGPEASIHVPAASRISAVTVGGWSSSTKILPLRISSAELSVYRKR